MPISYESFASFIEKFFTSVAAVIFCIVAVRISKKIVLKLSGVKFRNQIMSDRRSHTLEAVFVSFTKYTLYFITAYFILATFGGARFQSLIAMAGISGVAIGLGAQSLVKDVITGVFILLEDQYAVGDLIAVEGISGLVEDIGIRATKIRSQNGDIHIIPNGQITIVTNMTKDFKRAIVDVLVSYAENVERVLAVLKDEMAIAFQVIEGLSAIPEVQGIVEFNTFHMKIKIVALCQTKENWHVEREIRRMVKIRFEKEKIEMVDGRMYQDGI